MYFESMDPGFHMDWMRVEREREVSGMTARVLARAIGEKELPRVIWGRRGGVGLGRLLKTVGVDALGLPCLVRSCVAAEQTVG